MSPTTGQYVGPGAGVGFGRRRGLVAALAAVFVAFRPAVAAPLAADGDILFTAIVMGAVALALAAGLWALAEQNVSLRLRRLLRRAGARMRAAVGERDALLGGAREALIVWGRDGSGPYSYGGAEALLDSCLKGAQATELSKALDELSERGASFALTVRDQLKRKIRVRGRAVGGMAAVWIEPEAASAAALDFRSVLDALPVPVWLRDRALSLVWGNRAFLAATGARDAEAACREQVALERSERDMAAAAQAQSQPLEAKRFAIVGGQRRALAFTEVPVEAGVVGLANDVTEAAASEARLQQHIDAHTDTLDKLATAVAIFDRDQKLSFYNRAFVRLWNLPETWLDSRPGDGEILDRLREARKLPEQRDYQDWKRNRLGLYQTARDSPSEDLWHLPGGKTLRVVARPHPFGGLTFQYEDVTERITLESSYKTLTKVQSATLNTLQEAVAVFGPDGKLKLHNQAFKNIWTLKDEELAGEPHVRAIAACAEKFGVAGAWETLIQNIVSGANLPSELGRIERNDHTIIALALAPLPDGATLITFADVTDRFRVESMLRENAEVLETADRLKSEFIKHVSYLLRTPLTTIKGYAEHLLEPQAPGPLNERQQEYVRSIVAGSITLENLINDILDMALIEAGALRLELERLDLKQELEAIAGYMRDWAVKAGLTLVLDFPGEPSPFQADKRRIHQVVYNLLSNAFKYTPMGGTVALGGRSEGEDVQIYVRDNGPGIAPEVRASVFERFSAKSSSGQRGGAGLGLALVKRFVELHDGWVEIESGEGTLVRCHLPRRIAEERRAAGGE